MPSFLHWQAKSRRFRRPGRQIPPPFRPLILQRATQGYTKAQRTSVVCAFFFLLHAQSGHSEQVHHVLDGDTVELTNGVRVRLIGIDAPEVAHPPSSTHAEPFANAATRELKRLIDQSGGHVTLVSEASTKDKYGRILAHLIDKDGHNLAQRLLEKGLAVPLPTPPNTDHADTFQRSRDVAIESRAGIWQLPEFAVLDATSAARSSKKAHRVKGCVTRIETTAYARRTWLDDAIVLKTDRDEFPYFKNSARALSLQQCIEIFGETYTYRGQTRLRLRHPAQIKWEQ